MNAYREPGERLVCQPGRHVAERFRTLKGGEGPDESSFEIVCKRCCVTGWEFFGGEYSWHEHDRTITWQHPIKPRRWGATWLVRLFTWRMRWKRNTVRMRVDERRNVVLACWRQMHSSADMLYPVTCTCGHHKPHFINSKAGTGYATGWKYVDPRTVFRYVTNFEQRKK